MKFAKEYRIVKLTFHELTHVSLGEMSRTAGKDETGGSVMTTEGRKMPGVTVKFIDKRLTPDRFSLAWFDWPLAKGLKIIPNILNKKDFKTGDNIPISNNDLALAD